MEAPKLQGARTRDARLRTLVVRFLKERGGRAATFEEIEEGTGLEKEDARRAIEHNLYVDSLRKGLYYGVIQKVENDEGTLYKFNANQYRANRRAWHAARREAREGGVVGSVKKWLRDRWPPKGKKK